MDVSATSDLLDNPVWNALRGPQSSLRDPGSLERALRYDPEVALFAGIETVDAAGWDALAELVGPEGVAILFRDTVPSPPPGWAELYRGPTWQMLAGDLPDAPALELRPLGTEDVDDMLELTGLTVPGPFLSRTLEMGDYVGVHREGKLVAMAGERMRVPGFVEVSAVCTHPDVQRQGLGAALTLHMAHHIRARGDEAFLHVLAENENAVRLYRSIGFSIRRQVDVVLDRFEPSLAPQG